MMDDVLISNRKSERYSKIVYGDRYADDSSCPGRPVPPVLLRSALRTLVSQGSVTQRPFVEHIRKRLQESPPPLTDARELFPAGGVVSQACLEYIASTRCVFSSKLATESLP